MASAHAQNTVQKRLTEVEYNLNKDVDKALQALYAPRHVDSLKRLLNGDLTSCIETLHHTPQNITLLIIVGVEMLVSAAYYHASRGPELDMTKWLTETPTREVSFSYLDSCDLFSFSRVFLTLCLKMTPDS